MNQPSTLTSNTRSNSAWGLSGRKWLTSIPAAWMRASTRRPSRAGASASATCAGSVRSTWCQCAVPPAARTASSALSAARARSIRASSRSTSFGVGRSPRSRRRSASSRLSPSRSEVKRSMSGSSASGSGTRSSRWKVPPEASARFAVIAATMLPAAPVTTNVVSALSARAGSGSTACSDQAHRPPQAVRVPDLDRAGVGQRLRDQRLGERGGLAARLEVDRLYQQLLALAGERLGEAHDGSAHRRRRSGRVVAVAPTEARRCDQEGTRAGNLIGERPQRRREQLHPRAQPLAPGRRDRATQAAPRRRGRAAT